MAKNYQVEDKKEIGKYHKSSLWFVTVQICDVKLYFRFSVMLISRLWKSLINSTANLFTAIPDNSTAREENQLNNTSIFWHKDPLIDP